MLQTARNSILITCLTATFAAAEIPSGITWYGVLAEGLAEAKRTERPILLLSAAPQCGGIPGLW